MKSFVKILAVVGTGMLIGTVAGKYLKSERRQMGKNLRDFVNDSKLFSRSSVDKKQAELERQQRAERQKKMLEAIKMFGG